MHEDCTPRTWRRIRSSTKRVTEGTQAITGRFAVCLYYTNCSPRYCTHGWLHPCTKCNHLIRVDFRPDHQTVDHLMLYKVLEQRCREWNVPLCISTIDFTKAFDRMRHSALWSSLEHFGVKTCIRETSPKTLQSSRRRNGLNRRRE